MPCVLYFSTRDEKELEHLFGLNQDEPGFPAGFRVDFFRSVICICFFSSVFCLLC
jgi:hypothetical protein